MTCEKKKRIAPKSSNLVNPGMHKMKRQTRKSHLQLSILFSLLAQARQRQGASTQAGQNGANFPLQRQNFRVGIVHTGLDPGIQSGIVHVAQGSLAVDLGFLGRTDHIARHNNANLADAGQVGVEETIVDLLGRQSLGESLTRGIDHGVGDLDRLGEDSTQTDTREDIHVVTLAGVVGASLTGGVGEAHRLEGRARRKKHPAIGVSDSSLEVTLRLGGGVGQREDNGALVPVGHLAENLRGEDTAHGGKTHQDSGLHVVNNLLKGLQLQTVVVGPSKVDLVVSELVTAISSHETLGVNQVEAGAGLIFGHALTDEEVDDLLGNTDTSTASTEEDSTVLLAGKAGALDGIDHTTEDDSSSTLDVVIEARVNVAVTLQSGEGVLEVLELNDNTNGSSC